MKYIITAFIFILAITLPTSCIDDDEFSSSSSDMLTFSTDTVSMDTTFSNVPTVTHSFWVYNKSGKGLRNISARLEKMQQTGFRVNVDGSYLGQQAGWQLPDIEIRNGDSIRVFVELTSNQQNAKTPQRVDDNIVFTLESGVQQRVALDAWSWDATLVNGLEVTHDTTISSADRPLVIYRGIKVDSAATLTVSAGTTLYFHQNAGIDVYGRLLCAGERGKTVTLRGDRIDRMFSYLPYDLTPGLWQGVRFRQSSYNNEIVFADIHSPYNAVVCDSSDTQIKKLSVRNSKITNCQGYGIKATASNVLLENDLVANTLGDCVYIAGGVTEMNNCTLAQFYPFSGERGGAIRFTNRMEDGRSNPMYVTARNSLITGYADDVLFGEPDTSAVFNYLFANCMIRTPEVTTADSVCFKGTVFENTEDTVSCGEKHFRKIDTDNLRYDFHLDSLSAAIDKGNVATSATADLDGTVRDDKPDIGCYEYVKANTNTNREQTENKKIRRYERHKVRSLL